MSKMNSKNQLPQLRNDWTSVKNKLLKDEAAILFETFRKPSLNGILHKDSLQYIAFIIRGDSSRPKVISLGFDEEILKSAQNSSNFNESDALYSKSNYKIGRAHV